MAAMTIGKIAEHLGRFKPRSIDSEEMRRAAVLLLLRENAEKSLSVVLTRRAEKMGIHSGQVALPGGGLWEDESPKQAALREAHEEIGLLPDNVEVIGRLSDMITVTHFHVAPMVGWLKSDQEFIPEPAEVARVFDVPLSVLAAPYNWEKKPYVYNDTNIMLWHLYYDGEDIWGVSARILFEFLEVLGLPSPLETV